MTREILSLWETSPTCHRISHRLDNALPTASCHKKGRETPFSLLWVKQQISLMRAGCDYAFKKEKKSHKKRKKRGGGKSWQKPHIAQVPPPWRWLCTDLLVLVVGEVVQPEGAAWKQIFQVSARQKWMRTISQLSHCHYEWGKFVLTAWEFRLFPPCEKIFFSSERCLVSNIIIQILADFLFIFWLPWFDDARVFVPE